MHERAFFLAVKAKPCGRYAAWTKRALHGRDQPPQRLKKKRLAFACVRKPKCVSREI
jgi:hypothetical protein